ncbi:MAG: hypothetical protein RLZZ319_657 [Actinomycetota bacterium]
MKRTNPLTLVGLTPFGFGLGFGVDWLFVTGGRPAIQTPWSLSICLVLIGIAIVLLGYRVRWATKPEPGRRIDPITAVTIVTLAKASSVTGALVFGGTFGLLAFVLSRPVIAPSSIPANVGGMVASVLLVGAALVAEWMCTLPPRDPDGDPA